MVRRREPMSSSRTSGRDNPDLRYGHGAPVGRDFEDAQVSDTQESARDEFLAMVAELRPSLHRYCARMTGSAMDGEDVLQDALATAYFKMSLRRDPLALRSWIFRIAHNKCLDFLRARERRTALGADLAAVQHEQPSSRDPVESDQDTELAFEIMVGVLAPKERACVVLKDVLGHTLDEIALVVDSTIGGVKSALHRGRAKLRDAAIAAPSDGSPKVRSSGVGVHEFGPLVEEYVTRFNARDWDGLEELVAADARMEVVDVLELDRLSTLSKSYFARYRTMVPEPALSLGSVDGQPAVVLWRRSNDGGWVAEGLAKFESKGGVISGIRDYLHVPYMLDHCHLVAPPPAGVAPRE